MEIFDYEKEVLQEKKDRINNILNEEQIQIDNMYKEYIGPRQELWNLVGLKEAKMEKLKLAKENPYFARIDFKSFDNGIKECIYIGKMGISDEDGRIVTDWRAPISSLYYDSDIGKASYIAPLGKIEGELSLKRQFEIEEGELLNCFDVDLVTSDNLLQKYLLENNEARLKNIVSTIQKEQNEVIRRNLYKNIIVQGVAGSGKTTVALHRLAYLIYNNKDNVRQNDYLIIGPNPVFLKYIKQVLPDLDVNDVKQYTLVDYALNYIEEDINVIDDSQKLTENISGKLNNEIYELKSSLEYKEMIDKFLELYYESITSKDLMLDEFKVLDKDIIRNIFKEYDDREMSLSAKIELAIDRLSRYINDNNDDIRHSYNKYVYELFDNISDEEAEITRKKTIKNREEIDKDCKTILRKYFARYKISPTKLYKVFIDNIDKLGYSNKCIKKLKQQTLKNIRNKSYDFEDLAALIYVKSLISPSKVFNDIKQVVVDEAQDLGEFNLFAMKKTMPNAYFSIFGDLAQSIYDYRKISSWEEINTKIFDGKAEIANFNKSYRTTRKIMEAADNIELSIGLNPSEQVIRKGEDISFINTEGMDLSEVVKDKIEKLKSEGYKTIGIISKTKQLSEFLNDDLYIYGIIIPDVKEEDDITSDRYNICTISNQLSKGLEFDAVIISDASEKMYSSNSKLDMKLLYVAITRALHKVEILYNGELTKPLNKIYLNSKEKVKVKR